MDTNTHYTRFINSQDNICGRKLWHPEGTHIDMGEHANLTQKNLFAVVLPFTSMPFRFEE